MNATNKSREDIAKAEIGRTAIKPRAAWTLALFFLALIYSEPLLQHALEWRAAKSAGTPWAPASLEIFRGIPETLAPLREHGLKLSSIIEANKTALAQINEYETELEDESAAARKIRPYLQTFFSSWPGVGNEQAYIGRHGWLFYRPGFDHLTGPGFLDKRQMRRRAASESELAAAPHPDPRTAIVDFKNQLAERGIKLIVTPVPVKPSIHPEKFSASLKGKTLENKSFRMFVEQLEKEGVIVFDPSDFLSSKRDNTGKPQYLATDTHWLPESMEGAARKLAGLIRPLLSPEKPGTLYRRVESRVKARGDIALMLDLTKTQTLYPPETVVINQVFTDDNQFWRASDDAEILVLGDSYSNIYSLEPMGWGESAGFVEQLAFYLNTPVDRMLRNDNGSFATRDMLSRELARGNDRLAGKKVVVWQFSARELSAGDWRPVKMALHEKPETTFFVPAPGERVQVTGTVNTVSTAPRPGTVPYRDHIVSIHLVDLPDNGSAVVYMLSMVDNEWTRAARLRSGQEITITLRPWSDVSARYEGFNRTDLDDFELQLQEPCWGEWD